MATILAYPTKPEDEKSLLEFVNALNIRFETSSYSPEFVNKIISSTLEIKESKVTAVKKKEELHTLLNSL